MVELTQFVITGITVGMVYSLVALGFVLVWKSSGVANLAHRPADPGVLAICPVAANTVVVPQ